MKGNKAVKKSFHNSQGPKVMSSNCFFYSANGPEHKDSSFSIRNDQGNQQILTVKKFEPGHICLIEK